MPRLGLRIEICTQNALWEGVAGGPRGTRRRCSVWSRVLRFAHYVGWDASQRPGLELRAAPQRSGSRGAASTQAKCGFNKQVGATGTHGEDRFSWDFHWNRSRRMDEGDPEMCSRSDLRSGLSGWNSARLVFGKGRAQLMQVRLAECLFLRNLHGRKGFTGALRRFMRSGVINIV